METDLGSAIFCNDTSDEQHGCENILAKEKEEKQEKQVLSDELEMVEEKWCNMYFDGAVSKEGVGADISIIGPKFEYRSFSYKLYFNCTNNVAEYRL